MPTYSYACTECGDRFDAVQAFSDSALTTCAKCNGRLRKLFGNVGVVFKGSGFYRTDSRESAKSSAKSSTNGSASSSESTAARRRRRSPAPPHPTVRAPASTSSAPAAAASS